MEQQICNVLLDYNIFVHHCSARAEWGQHNYVMLAVQGIEILYLELNCILGTNLFWIYPEFSSYYQDQKCKLVPSSLIYNRTNQLE